MKTDRAGEACDSYDKELKRAKRQIQRLKYDLQIAKIELEESVATIEYLTDSLQVYSEEGLG